MCFRLMMTSLKQMKEIWKEDVNKQLISKNISCHDEKHITHDICRHLETLFFPAFRECQEGMVQPSDFTSLRSAEKSEWNPVQMVLRRWYLNMLENYWCLLLCLVFALFFLILWCDWLFNPNKTLNLKSKLPGIILWKWKTKQGLWNIRCLCEHNELSVLIAITDVP